MPKQDIMNNTITYVIGHKNPDTDSVCSAIALARLKTVQGATNVVPARAGDLNHQTAFILDHFDVPSPVFLSNVYPRAKDIMSTGMRTALESTPMYHVMKTIRDNNIRFVPVLNEEKRPVGVITLMDLAERQLDRAEVADSRKVLTTLQNVVETLGGEVVTDYLGKSENSFSLYVGAMKTGSFLKVLTDIDPKNCAVIVGDRDNIQKASVDMGVGLLVVTGGLRVTDDIVKAAEAKQVTIVISPFDTATTAQLVRSSTPARALCNQDFMTAQPDELTEDLKQRFDRDLGRRGVIVLDADGTMQGVVTKSDLLKPSGIRLILVDHNELSQAVDGADSVPILEVVDHHRLGNFHTADPISFVCEPVGSTSTLVSELYRKSGFEIEEKIAGLLLSGVMSDTVLLRSPTTTDRDRDIIPWLEDKSGLDHASLGEKIFAAASSIEARGVRSVINDDFKTYVSGEGKFGIGQVEVIRFDEFYENKDALKKELLEVAGKAGLELAALLVTDITLGTSLLLAVGEKKALYGLHYPTVSENVYELKNVLSRKKQVAPHMISLFKVLY